MFATASLARSIEAAEARLTRAAALAAKTRFPASLIVDLGDGVAVASGANSPFDKVIGLGFDPLDWEAFEDFERKAFGFGKRLRVELATLADPTIAQALTSRGFELRGFENVLGLELEALTLSRLPPEWQVERVEGAGSELSTWIETVTTGFLHPDGSDGTATPEESFDREVLRQVFMDMAAVPGFVRVLARRGNEIAGGASLRVDGAIAQLAGAATLPEYRRRGVQSALLCARLEIAVRAGCRVAVVTTAPGSRSQHNVMRAGFSLLYARAVLVREVG